MSRLIMPFPRTVAGFSGFGSAIIVRFDDLYNSGHERLGNDT